MDIKQLYYFTAVAQAGSYNNQLWRAKNILRQQIIERRQKE